VRVLMHAMPDVPAHALIRAVLDMPMRALTRAVLDVPVHALMRAVAPPLLAMPRYSLLHMTLHIEASGEVHGGGYDKLGDEWEEFEVTGLCNKDTGDWSLNRRCIGVDYSIWYSGYTDMHGAWGVYTSQRPDAASRAFAISAGRQPRVFRLFRDASLVCEYTGPPAAAAEAAAAAAASARGVAELAAAAATEAAAAASRTAAAGAAASDVNVEAAGVAVTKPLAAPACGAAGVALDVVPGSAGVGPGSAGVALGSAGVAPGGATSETADACAAAAPAEVWQASEQWQQQRHEPSTEAADIPGLHANLRKWGAPCSVCVADREHTQSACAHTSSVERLTDRDAIAVASALKNVAEMIPDMADVPQGDLLLCDAQNVPSPASRSALHALDAVGGPDQSCDSAAAHALLCMQRQPRTPGCMHAHPRSHPIEVFESDGFSILDAHI